jgi:hypothetical protein
VAAVDQLSARARTGSGSNAKLKELEKRERVFWLFGWREQAED